MNNRRSNMFKLNLKVNSQNAKNSHRNSQFQNRVHGHSQIDIPDFEGCHSLFAVLVEYVGEKVDNALRVPILIVIPDNN